VFDGDIFAGVAFWPSLSVALQTADPHIIKVHSLPPLLTIICRSHRRQQQVATQHSAFPKPLALYKPLSFFGPSILTTEGEEWRRHRKVVARSFGETNHRLVWQETIKIMLDLFTHWGRQGNGDEIKVTSVRETTREIAVMVIGIAGKDAGIIMN